LQTWQQKNMVVYGGRLDPTTRELLAMGVRGRAFDAFLRVLRERVVSATGLIEDGSAIREWGTILGRHIEAPSFRARAGNGGVEGGAPDLISPATEAAARALGWTDFDG